MRKPLLRSSGSSSLQNQDSVLLSKLSKSSTSVVSKNKGNINSTIQLIRLNVDKYLGRYKDNVESCRDINSLSLYIDKSIKNGVIAIDTETTGLDCRNDKIIGVCLYTPNEKAIYVPLRHKSYITGQLLSNQVSLPDITKQLSRIVDSGINTVFHNAKFDIRVIKNDLGVNIKPYWDTMIAAKLLNNLESASLKFQYATHILNEDKEYDFDSLFKNIDNNSIPIETFTLYAATDPYITYELYEYQRKQFELFPKIYDVFKDIEMPLIPVVAKMEDTGVCIDLDYAYKLSTEYHRKENIVVDKINKELLKYNDKILAYKSNNPKNKLSNPINIASPTQLAILFYDILQVGVIDEKSPRGVDKDILPKIDLPIAKLIVEYRELEKLIGTYIDKLPQVADKKTNKIHASFNQIGADTGRFSSSDPKRIFINWGRKIQLTQGRAIA